MSNIIYSDRYDALGPHNGCTSECEGTGWIPVEADDKNKDYAILWNLAEEESPSDDGYHFIPCPQCNPKAIELLSPQPQEA